MSVEQITMDPLPENKSAAKRKKDPKKVAAGKKLAEYNRKAKEALAREMKREAEMTTQVDEEEGSSQAWIPELSFTTVLSIVGLGFTAVDMFMRYRKNRVSQVPTESFKEPPTSKIPIPQNTNQTSKPPKMGML